MFVITEDGVVVVEPCNLAHSTLMLQEIRELTEQPIKYLIHTHDHWDHSSGGQVFRDAGAQILAHSEAVTSMKENGNSNMAIPDLEWSGETLDMVVGGLTFKLTYLGINHGNGMTVVQLIDYSLIYVADLVTAHRVLFIIVPDFNIPEWERSLEQIIAMYWEVGIFSHSGNPDLLTPGTKEDAILNLQLIRDIRQACLDLLAQGYSTMEIPGMIDLPQYSNWALYDGFLAMNAWRILLDEIMGPYPWRPVPGEEKTYNQIEIKDVSNTVLH